MYMTSCDYNMVMTRTVGIADLKAKLSEYLNSVRQGQVVTVLDRGTPVARIVPYGAEPVEVRKATRRPEDMPVLPAPASPTNSLAILLEERGRR